MGTRAAAWVVGILAGLAILVVLLFLLGIRFGYIDIISKYSSGSTDEAPSSVR